MNAATSRADASALLVELKLADAIIKAMLNAMTMQQKIKAHEALHTAGVCGEGLTRHHERAAVIAAATKDMLAVEGITNGQQGIAALFGAMDDRRQQETPEFSTRIAQAYLRRARPALHLVSGGAS